MVNPQKLRELLSECAPLPWATEHDWTLELKDATGSLLGKFMAGASAPGKPSLPLILYLVNNAESIAYMLEELDRHKDAVQAISEIAMDIGCDCDEDDDECVACQLEAALPCEPFLETP